MKRLWKRCARRIGQRPVRPYAAESLESRTLLSISWVNKGVSSGDDNDRFDLVFGALANQARNVVEASIDFWERSINSFNYGDGGNDIYEMKIQMNEIPLVAGSNVGANAGFYAQRNGKPSKGSMGIGWLFGVTPGTNSAAGYFLDPTPYESSEFQGTWSDGFVRANTAALGGADLFSITLHELGHAMGLAATSQTNAQSVDTEYSDTVNTPASVPPATLWLYDNGNGSLWTEWDSGGASGTPVNAAGPGHFAPKGTSAVRLGVTYFGAVALMNALVTSRSIISDIEMDAAARVYGYTTTPPSRYGTTYGQLDGDGKLRIDTTFLSNSSDVITLSSSGSVLTLTLDTGKPVAGIDPVGAVTSIFSLPSVTSIDIKTGAGSDSITIGAGVPATTIFGGAAAAGAPAETDTLTINGVTGSNSLNASQFTGNSHNITNINGIENVVINGGSGNETVTIAPQSGAISFNVTFNGGTGDDTLNLASATTTLDTIPGTITFDGVAGLTDKVILNDQASVTGYGYNTSPTSVQRDGAFGGLIYSNLDKIVLNCGSGNDTIGVILGAIAPFELHGNGGFDTITFNDHVGVTGRTWNINQDQVIVDGALTGTAGFEGVGILAGNGADQITFSGGQTQAFNIDAGGGADTFTVGLLSQAVFASTGATVLNGGEGNDGFIWQRGSNNWAELIFGTFTSPLTLDGGGGYNSLSIDDSVRANTSYGFYANRFYAFEPAAFPAGADFNYDNMAAIGVTCSGGNNPFAVYGTSSDIDPGNQVTIVLGGGTDSMSVYPHDAAGNLTINGNLGIGGGAGTDSLTINDTASTLPINYVFQNTFGSGTTNVGGMGGAGFGAGSDVESLIINAGAGNDTFTIEKYLSTTTALTINGGVGNDTLEFMPVSKNLGANLPTTQITMIFNGGTDSDSLGIHNDNNNNGNSYTINNTQLTIQNLIGSAIFGLFMSHTSFEHTSITGGPKADTMLVYNSLAGTTYDLNAGPGAINDAWGIGQPVPPSLTSGIHGAVNIDGVGGADTVSIVNNTEPVGRTVHIENNYVGRLPGDNFFGTGGSLHFANITGTMSFIMSSGADNVYVQPNVTTPITINGFNPTSAPGDTLNLATAGVLSPVVNGTIASGNLTSSNCKIVIWSGFEAGPNTDAIAPAVVSADINVDGPAGAALPSGPPSAAPPIGAMGPSLEVLFSEAVALLLGTGAIGLTNATLSQPVPQASLDFTYDPATHIAHFTFPGYPGGILPDGNYLGSVLAGSADDLFGNMLAATPIGFFILSADANHDRHVDASDFTELAQHFNTATTFTHGDFNYDGRVNGLDFNALATKFGTYLAPMASSPAAPIERSLAVAAQVRADLFGDERMKADEPII